MRARKCGSRSDRDERTRSVSLSLADRSSQRLSPSAVEVLQEGMSCLLDLLVSPLGGPVLAREQATPVESTEVTVGERVPGFGLLRRIVSESQKPFAVLMPRVRLEEGVLVLGARLDVSPRAVEDVLVSIDELPCSRHGGFVHGIGGHRPILARMSAAAK